MIIKRTITTVVIIFSLVFLSVSPVFASCRGSIADLFTSSTSRELKSAFSNIESELNEIFKNPTPESYKDFLSRYPIEDLLRFILKEKERESLSAEDRDYIEQVSAFFASFIEQFPEDIYKKTLNEMTNENILGFLKQSRATSSPRQVMPFLIPTLAGSSEGALLCSFGFGVAILVYFLLNRRPIDRKDFGNLVPSLLLGGVSMFCFAGAF